MITEGAAPVVAIVTYTGVEAATAVIGLKALIAAGGATLGIIANNICSWAGACSSSSALATAS